MKAAPIGQRLYPSAPGNVSVYNGSLLLAALPLLPLLSGGTGVKWLGYGGLFAAFLILIKAPLRRRRRNEFGLAHLFFLSLLPIGVISASLLDSQALVQTVQIFLIALVIWQGPTLAYTNRAAKFSTKLCLVLCVFALADLIYGSDVLSGNPNLYGVAAFCWGAIAIKNRTSHNGRPGRGRMIALLMVPFVTALASGSRSSLAAILLMIAWIEVGRLPVLKGIRSIGALLVICAPIILLLNVNSDSIGKATELIPAVGEKHALSGRDAIWSSIYDSVSSNGFSGFGLGSMPGDLQNGVNDGLSAHNGFFQIFYQFGAWGFAVYVLTFALLIKRMHRRDDGGISVAILLGAIVLESFEVVMTQNHFGAGLSLWAIAALSSVSLNRGPGK